MKKSKVLIPAMALLLFSTAASITGTVAWFTSSRIFNTEAGIFTVSELDGNMECTLTEGAATDVVDSSTASGGKAIKFETGTTLMDASVNLHNGHAYRINRDASDFADYDVCTANKAAPNASELKWFYGTYDNVKYYVAASWTMTFKYTFNAEAAPSVGIYLNLNTSVLSGADDNTNKNGQANGANNTALGFRIGFVAGTSYKVWSNHTPFSGTASAYSASATYAEDDYVINAGAIWKCTTAITTAEAWTPAHWTKTNESTLNTNAAVDLQYVSSTSGTTSYNASGADHYIVKPNDYALASDETVANENANREDRIATITKSTGTDSVAVTCYAWFDGTDPNIVSSTDSIKTDFQKMTANMKFYARSDFAS